MAGGVWVCRWSCHLPAIQAGQSRFNSGCRETALPAGPAGAGDAALAAGGLVNRGYFCDFTVAAAAIDDLVQVSSGVRVVTDSGSRRPAGAGFGDYLGETRRRLAAWHTTVRRRPA